MYLYFNETLKKIVACVAPTEKEGLTPLTAEQVERWEENPRAHWSQIMNEPTHYEPPAVTEPTLDELKAEAVKKLSDLSLDVLGSWVSEYQLMNAILSLKAEPADKIYDDEKANTTVADYLRVGKQCRSLFYEAKSAIEACETNEQVKGVKDEYTDYYEKLRKK
jgi:hypothetical protein